MTFVTQVRMTTGQRNPEADFSGLLQEVNGRGAKQKKLALALALRRR